MNKFGFSISPSSTLDLDKTDKSIFDKLAVAEPDVLKCMACGSCAATCSAGQFTDMNFRKIILMLNRGDNKKALEMIRKCMLCGKCIYVCPRGINTRHAILTISKL